MMVGDPATMGLTLAFQAAGLIGGYKSMRNNLAMSKQAANLERQQNAMNMQAIKNQSAQASLFAMQDLRKNMGYQLATQTARGTEMAGSALALLHESETNFNKDEQIRRMNTLAKEADLRAAGVISGMHTFAAQSKLKSDFFNAALKMGVADINAFALEK